MVVHFFEIEKNEPKLKTRIAALVICFEYGQVVKGIARLGCSRKRFPSGEKEVGTCIFLLCASDCGVPAPSARLPHRENSAIKRMGKEVTRRGTFRRS